MTRTKVRKIVEKLGATMTVNCEWPDLDVTIDAQRGMIWSGPGVHAVVGSRWDAEPASVIWKSLYNDVKAGVEPCPYLDCDVCGEDS